MWSYVSVHRLELATPGLNWSSVNVSKTILSYQWDDVSLFHVSFVWIDPKVSPTRTLWRSHCKNIMYPEMRNTPNAKIHVNTMLNFTCSSFYICEQSYIYVKIHMCVNFAHVNCTLKCHSHEICTCVYFYTCKFAWCANSHHVNANTYLSISAMGVNLH